MSIELPKNQIITPQFRVIFQSLLEPKVDETYGGPPKYVVEALFEDSNALQNMKDLCNRIVQEKWQSNIPKKLRSPFLEGDDSEREEYAGKIYMRFRSQYPIRVVGPDKVPITDESQVYSGIWGRAVVLCKAYGGANPGVSFYLLAFQKIRDGEPLMGPSADQYFDEIPGEQSFGDSDLPF